MRVIKIVFRLIVNVNYTLRQEVWSWVWCVQWGLVIMTLLGTATFLLWRFSKSPDILLCKLDESWWEKAASFASEFDWHAVQSCSTLTRLFWECTKQCDQKQHIFCFILHCKMHSFMASIDVLSDTDLVFIMIYLPVYWDYSWSGDIDMRQNYSVNFANFVFGNNLIYVV